MLGADDKLPFRPRRVVVAGVSGVGKTTTARRIGELLDLPHTELDGLFHGPGWVPRPSFEADVDALVAQERWVTEWQYNQVRERVVRRAELLVWLDLPFRVTLTRLTRRTVLRRVRREELWNGNTEGPLHTFLTDHEHVVRYAIAGRHKFRDRVPATLADAPHLTGVRLGSAAQVTRWLEGLRSL